MPSPIPIQPGVFYHIFNRGTNGENLFIEERNYRYFLELYCKYIEPVAATYAYCLLRNHFHIMVWVYTLEEKVEVWSQISPGIPYQEVSASKAFSNLFNAYSKAISKAYGRTGSVFEHPYHRIPIRSTAHFLRLIPYIHKNPQKHGFVQDYRDWPFSSYKSLVSFHPTRIKRDTTLKWFSGVKGFLQAHQRPEIDEEVRYLVDEDEF